MEQFKLPYIQKKAAKLAETLDFPGESKFSKLKIEAILPVFSKNIITAILLLGKKSSGEKYLQEDLD